MSRKINNKTKFNRTDLRTGTTTPETNVLKKFRASSIRPTSPDDLNIKKTTGKATSPAPAGKAGMAQHRQQHQSLKCVSWNISFLKPSQHAPKSWNALDSQKWIRQDILMHDPDIIALQESPYPEWGSETFGPYGYTSAGTSSSHCYYIDILIRQTLFPSTERFSTPPRNRINLQSKSPTLNIPAVAVKVPLMDSLGIDVTVTFASCHLEPFGSKEAKAKRKKQMHHLIQSISTENYIILGDMNMRQDEDKGILALGSSNTGPAADDYRGHDDPPLRDSWACRGTKENKFTWNSKVNHFHEGGYEYTARYDRAYFRGGGLSVQSFGFVGDEPLDDEHRDMKGGERKHYLSDHFGIIVEFDISGDVS